LPFFQELQKEAAKGIVGACPSRAIAALASKAPLSGAEATVQKEAKMAREAARAPVTRASKEKETTFTTEKESKPLKEAARIPVTEASKEGDATPVPTAKAKDKGKEKSPSLGQANLEV
jgi:hypothetical protein